MRTLRLTPLKYKSLDLGRWRPDLQVPAAFRLPPTKKLRILHSFYKADREHGKKNIKGSPFVEDAV